MCYDIKVSLERQLKVARQHGDPDVIAELERKLLPLLNPTEKELNHVSGFAHPKLFVLTKTNVEYAEWGLIPHWVKDKKSAKEISNKTLNAKGETIFEKPSFKDSALFNRCIVFVDGFYESQHLNGKTYPHFIQRSDKNLIPMAGLASNWKDPQTDKIKSTFTIVTCSANKMMSKIHNNPKLSESRMPLVIEDDLINEWLNTEASIKDHLEVDAFIKPALEELLESHTVKRFRKDTPNSSDSADQFYYPELGPTLFD